jgi:hypothetical protein
MYTEIFFIMASVFCSKFLAIGVVARFVKPATTECSNADARVKMCSTEIECLMRAGD